jgi:hypothetical protein
MGGLRRSFRGAGAVAAKGTATTPPSNALLPPRPLDPVAASKRVRDIWAMSDGREGALAVCRAEGDNGGDVEWRRRGRGASTSRSLAVGEWVSLSVGGGEAPRD